MASKRRVVLAAAVGLNMAMGVLYAWSVFGKALAEPVAAGGFGWSRTLATLPYTVAIAAFALIMIPAGHLQDRIGPRVAATAGAAFCGLGLLVASIGRADMAWPVLAGFGILSGVGIGLGYSAATPAAVKWFSPAMKGRITGLVVAGVGLAPVYIAPLAKALISAWGIAGAFRALGFMVLALAGTAARFIANPPAGYVPPEPPPRGASPRASVPHGPDTTWRSMVRSPRFWALYVQLVCASTAGLMIIGHAARIVSSQSGGAIRVGYLFVALIAVFNAAGRATAGHVSDSVGRAPALIVVCLAQAAVMLAFGRITGPAGFLVGLALAGFNFGSCLSIFPAMAADLWGTRNFGLNYGLLFTAWGVGGVFGPALAGMIADATGSYAGAYRVAAGLLLVAVALAAAGLGRSARDRAR